MNVQTVPAKALRQKSPIVASYPWQTSVLNVTDLVGVFQEKYFKVLTIIIYH
jgi:hypothetical protein